MSKRFNKSELQSWNSLSSSFSVLLILVLTGCTPIYQADHDFSFMPDDVFTRIIKKTHFEYFVEGSGKEAKIHFDRNAAQKMARGFWLGKSANDMIKLFSSKQGSCRHARSRRYLYCSVSRYWRLKWKTGYWTVETSDTDKRLAKPGARLRFHFKLDGSARVVGVDVESDDIGIVQYRKNDFKPRPYPVASRPDTGTSNK